MEFRVLGPLEVRDGDRLLPLGGAKQRALLAMFVLNANRVVSRDRLIDELWGEEPPETVVTSVHVYVSQLRKLLGPEALVTRPPGYLLQVGADELDVQRFERLLAEGREALAAADPGQAAHVLRDALALWLGPALAEFASEPFAQAEIGRLEDLRLAAVEERIEADLALGRHADLIGELEALIAENPYRERLRAQLMLALYRSGRQAEALDAYKDARRALVDELGIEPSAGLQQLEKQILTQDAALGADFFVVVEGLPTGTATFLFTDVEASTALLSELGADAYAEEIARHRMVLREAVNRHGGVEVDRQGDALFVAFASAREAVTAAREAQKALANGAVRVRMGLHTGEALLVDEGYVGMDVHRAARIAAAAHGGQVLLSDATRALLDASFAVRDLGEHWLKDLSTPERLYQFGDGEFSPLKSLYRMNLPAQPTPLVGRTRELAEVVELVRGNRLVTLTGTAGVGKTRLALQAAQQLVDEFADGVWFVSLASLDDPDLLEPTIVQVVGAAVELNDFLRHKRQLLVLDNLEQLLPGVAPTVARLEATVLATSRERLNVSGEHEYPVPTLPFEDAVALFTQRARQLEPRFEPEDNVAEIARRLDGLPLAIELAAARVKALTPAQIVERLSRSLDVLTGGARDAPERQQTLRATIEWSYQLLNEQEQTLFARLAVFAGGCTLEAAEQVADAELDVLQSLVEKNLLRHSEARFWMLETIRELALEKLELREDAEQLQRRHAQYLIEFLRTLEESGADAARRAREHAESDNLRAAVEWALHGQHTDLALSLALRSAQLTAPERVGWLDASLLLADRADPTVRAEALAQAAFGYYVLGDFDRVETLAQRSHNEFVALGDPVGQSKALQRMAFVAQARGENDRARELLEESIERAEATGTTGTTHRWSLHNLGELELFTGNLERAASLYKEALQLALDAADTQQAAQNEHGLGDTALAAGDTAAAEHYYLHALSLAREIDARRVIAYCLAGLASVAARRRQREHAGRLWGASEAFQRGSGIELLAFERRLYEDALTAVAGPEFEHAANATRNAEPDEALTAALAD